MLWRCCARRYIKKDTYLNMVPSIRWDVENITRSEKCSVRGCIPEVGREGQIGGVEVYFALVPHGVHTWKHVHVVKVVI